MKAILATLVLLQLVLLNEGFFDKSKPVKSCPPNPKLQALQKTLGLRGVIGRRKRTTTDFPLNCLHAAIVEFDDGPFFVQSVFECCNECHFPQFVGCILNGFPDYICGSRAHQCACDCRGAVLPEATSAASSGSGFNVKDRFKKTNPSSRVCKKTTCGRDGCCVGDQCIKLFIHQTKSAVRQK